MTTTAPIGFAAIFPGWNVWAVYQAQDPSQSLGDAVLNAGLSMDRRLQIWVEDETKAAPGAAVADPLNPAALRGDQIQIIPNPGALPVALTRAPIPELGGTVQIGKDGSPVHRSTVRFFNRGTQAFLPWPHDENYLLDEVYLPTPGSPITSAPAPSSLPGTLNAIGSGVGATIDTLAIAGAVALGAVILINLTRSRK